MTKRITQLAEQADAYAKAEYEKWTPTDDFSGVPHIRKIFNEKFAELIVRECMRVAMDEIVSDEDIDNTAAIEDRCHLEGNNGGVVDAVVSIKQHFGIAE